MTPFPLILSAPSGGGKTTIAKRVLAVRDDIGYSVSCTTREPRAGELDGRDYYFLEKADFLERQARGDFAESAAVHGNLYGTLRTEIDRVLGDGRHVMMDIDVQGADQFQRAFPGSVSVFILPPSADVLLERLRARQTESSKQVGDRIRSALLELEAVGNYEYVVINDVLEEAVRRVSAIIDAEVVRHDRLSTVQDRVSSLFDRLSAELHKHPS